MDVDQRESRPKR